ncbi:MAG: L,D-transpeptidase [Synechocystis sp.]|jgi:lipoprotein-anchoring transpeptidase ErfK/SrfK|nr:L,D-transpeptidase [Synechocystis sp.]
MNRIVSPVVRFALGLGCASLAVASFSFSSPVQAETTATTPTPTAPLSETLPPLPTVTVTETAATSETTKPLATHLVLVLGERKVYAYQDSKILASYPVAIGKKGWETPKGNFKVTQMVENPIWENPWNGKRVPASLDGPIGVRWIGFWSDGKNTIGFHGTPKKHEHLLGKAVSHGCVRMRNPDVIALYEIVKTGIPVSVVQSK